MYQILFTNGKTVQTWDLGRSQVGDAISLTYGTRSYSNECVYQSPGTVAVGGTCPVFSGPGYEATQGESWTAQAIVEIAATNPSNPVMVGTSGAGVNCFTSSCQLQLTVNPSATFNPDIVQAQSIIFGAALAAGAVIWGLRNVLNLFKTHPEA